ncbi:AAA family ATPase [Streptomyces sp. P01-B04]|uniref:ATP-binding protein n=1 Tax=Streptomyces poriferorum TaxID=2798799 RepID=UPI001C5CDA42|nr:ATP-binding protein [Streptomyces poriferorum]MBW5252445.1 AAA family ATPase [Streptomyces poriferorum]MBW5259098.1 AAA family ATPase [Streptomyces poriferorum]
MRVSSIKITGFKAIRHAELSELDAQPFTVLTGQNGTGKSTVLEALYLMTRGLPPEPQPELVRLGEERAEVAMAFSLTDGQFEQVDQYYRSVHGESAEKEKLYRRMARIDKEGNVVFSGSPVAATVFAPAFRKSHPFPGLTMVHAERGRVSGLDVFGAGIGGLQPGDPSGSKAAADYLTSCLMALDYRSLLESRQGRYPRDDYGDLAGAFHEATGKRLLRPQPMEGFKGGRIEVELGAGQRHGLSGLASGESGLLGLLCALYHSAADGGVLLLDEPELHLHPVLQTTILRTVRTLAPRTQTIIVTHAVKIAAAAHPSQVYQIQHSSPDQALRAVDALSLVGVIADMGIEQADLLGKACHLVVEGVTDNSYLGRLFPDEMERVHVTVAGNCQRVLAHHVLLTDGPKSLPWVCLIDRDLMNEADVQGRQTTYPGLYIWPRRALENMLLDPALLAAVLKTIGRSTSLDEAEEILRNAADRLMGDVVTDMLQAALAREFPLPRPDGSRGDRGLKQFYAASAHAMQSRGDAVETVRVQQETALQARWEQERLALVDPKKALGILTGQLKLFRRTEDLTGALLARAAQDPSVRPRGLEEFRLRLMRSM